MADRDWVWDHTPSYRRTTSFGKRWITVGSRLWQKYGATRWADLDKMTDKQVDKIVKVYQSRCGLEGQAGSEDKGSL